MAVSRALRRLLCVLELEEEQRKLALESALGELRRLEAALGSAGNRDRRGRQLVRTGAARGALPGRASGGALRREIAPRPGPGIDPPIDPALEPAIEPAIDRLAGIEETRAALRCASALKPRIAAAAADVMDLRAEFLAKRVERRQAETLIEEAAARDALEASRRSQQSLDDWYLNRYRGAARAEANTPQPPAGPDFGTDGGASVRTDGRTAAPGKT